jgi:hypothetical protein
MSIFSEIPSGAKDSYSRINYDGSRQQFASGFTGTLNTSMRQFDDDRSSMEKWNDLWVRFSPPRMCYAIDDEDEMVSIIKQLIADEAVFKVITKGDEWVETTLTRPHDKCDSIPGHSVRCVSWSGRFDRYLSPKGGLT